MSTKDIQFTDNKISAQQGSYVQKTPFFIDDILHQRSEHHQSSQHQQQHKISANKLSNINNNADNVITELNNKIVRNNHINDLMASGNGGHGSDEDYRKILQHER